MPNFSWADSFLIQADRMLKTLTHALDTNRPNPANTEPEQLLNQAEQKLSQSLMRINHAGEVAAQALYYGQSMFARNPDVQKNLMQAAQEEGDHLVWCQERLKELNGRTSYLDFFWYSGAFLLGALAGLVSDQISLSFLAETEHQVARHLQNHLNLLPSADLKSRAIVNFMREDEIHHARSAELYGASTLPFPLPELMKAMSRVMTKTAYWI